MSTRERIAERIRMSRLTKFVCVDRVAVAFKPEVEGPAVFGAEARISGTVSLTDVLRPVRLFEVDAAMSRVRVDRVRGEVVVDNCLSICQMRIPPTYPTAPGRLQSNSVTLITSP